MPICAKNLNTTILDNLVCFALEVLLYLQGCEVCILLYIIEFRFDNGEMK